MFSKKNLFVAAVSIFTIFFGVSAANAQDPGCQYNLASLQGSYAVIVNYGANVAIGLRIETLDGRGNLTSTGILNQPTPGSTTGERTVGTVLSTGTYTVNCDGTGVITRIVTRPDGTKASAVDDFVITRAIASENGRSENGRNWPHPRAIATTIVDAQRTPSVILSGGVFVTRVHTRLPDAEER
jgi:hypothetical protein